MRVVGLTLGLWFTIIAPDPAVRAEGGTVLIDDFTSEDGLSALGTRWSAFTDRVMGGISSGRAEFVAEEDRIHLSLRGTVSLENNGGFVQVALPLSSRGRAIDASDFRGLRLRVRGNGEDYAIHLRTDDCRLPWQYYEARFSTSGEWQTVELPFDSFGGASLAEPLDTARLRRVALVASKKEMRAEVDLQRVEFHR